MQRTIPPLSALERIIPRLPDGTIRTRSGRVQLHGKFEERVNSGNEKGVFSQKVTILETTLALPIQLRLSQRSAHDESALLTRVLALLALAHRLRLMGHNLPSPTSTTVR